MRLHPENHLARLAVALKRATAQDARKALAEFRRARRATLQEFGAALLATGAVDRTGLEELRAISIATRMGCPGCSRAYRVPQADLEARIRCPSCSGILALATDQRASELAPGAGPFAEPVYVARRGEPGRLEEGLAFEDLEARADAEAATFLSIAEAIQRGRDATGGQVVDGVAHYRPALAWRRPRAAIVAAGCVAAVLLFVALLAVSATIEADLPLPVVFVGAAVVIGGTALLAWTEKAPDRTEDRLLVSDDLGVVQVQGGWIRRVAPEDLARIEIAGRELVVAAKDGRTTIRLGPKNGYVGLGPIRARIESLR